MSLCDYSSVLGNQNEGFHKHIAGIALGDVLGTAAIAYGVSKMFNTGFLIVFIIFIIIATFVHWMFCVPTVLTTILTTFLGI